jgi:hypothetical protein
MNNENRGRLIRATGLYFFVVVILGGISLATPYTIADFAAFLPYVPDYFISVSIGVILLPILGGMTFFYIGTLFSIFFEGKLNRVLVSGMYAGSFVSVFGFLLILQPISEPSQMAGYLVFAAFSVFFAYNLMSALAQIRDQNYIRAISGAATIFILGQITIQLVNIYSTTPGIPPSDQNLLIQDMLNWGFTAASALTLLGIFRDSRNPYMAQVGEITSSYFFVVSMSLIATLYLNFIGGRLTQVSPVIKQLSPYVEWTGIVIIGAMIFTIMRRGMKESMMVPVEIGSWAKHIQDLSATKGKALEDFTEIIRGFINEGKKDRLLVKLFTFLDENKASEEEITRILSNLINYEDEAPPNFSKRGTSDKVKKQNQERRTELLSHTVGEIDNMGLNSLARETAPVPEPTVNVIQKLED